MNRRERRKINRGLKKSGLNINDLETITTVLDLSKEKIERALHSSHLRVNGVLYDVPRDFLNECLENEEYGMLKVNLNKSVIL